jgi:hypothetical protein
MTGSESTNDNFSTFSKETEDKLDIINLEPQTLVKVLKWPVILCIPSTTAIILTIIFYFGIGSIILIMVEGFFLLIGLTIIGFDRKRISRDKNTYTFTNKELIIKTKKGTENTISWEQISKFKIRGLYAKSLGSIKSEITTSYGDRIIIKLYCFNETIENIRDPHKIAKMIQKYYERMKK